MPRHYHRCHGCSYRYVGCCLCYSFCHYWRDMIYLITGVPGSGKTLYAVSTLIKKLSDEKIKLKDGSEVTRRVLVDGIPDLLLPHEVMPQLVEDQDKKDVFSCEGDGLLTWPKWCRPGDIIVVDEVQRYWRPRGMGTKPPEMIKALETHRHLGVDFVIITQNPMLIDQNVRRLVGRHQHIRRLFGMGRAVIYDWDACSVDVHRTKTATTTLWNYPKKAYDLYKSSALHVKQRQKIPLWLALPVVAVIGGLAIAPSAYGTLKGAMTGKGVSSVPVAVAAPASGASAPARVASAPVLASVVPVPAPVLPVDPKASKFSGCVVSTKKCTCFNDKGVLDDSIDDSECRDKMVSHFEPGAPSAPIGHVPTFADNGSSAGDSSVLAFMRKSRPASL